MNGRVMELYLVEYAVIMLIYTVGALVVVFSLLWSILWLIGQILKIFGCYGLLIKTLNRMVVERYRRRRS